MKRLWRSPTVRSMVVYSVSGVGFVGANLVLARMLPAAQYGLFTLVTALANLAYSLAPMGLDGVVLRRHVGAGPRLLRQVMVASTLTGLGFTVIGAVGYELSLPLMLMLLVSTIAGGAMMVASAQFQSQRRFGISLGLTQSPNLVLLLAALVVIVAHSSGAWLPLLIATLGFVVAAIYGWRALLEEQQGQAVAEQPLHWGEAFAFAGLQASGLLLIQLDRLIIPHVLPLHDLATYGVLAAFAGSLFRVLQMGVGFSLLPRLRAAADVPARRKLIAHEARLVGGIVLLGSAFIWLVTPLLERWFLAGKYHLAASLVLAAIVAGIAKIMNAFAKATVSALCEPRELTLVNLTGWISVGIAIAAAVIGARWGLAGVIYGVGLGWLLRALAAFYLTMRHLRLPSSVPVTAP